MSHLLTLDLTTWPRDVAWLSRSRRPESSTGMAPNDPGANRFSMVPGAPLDAW